MENPIIVLGAFSREDIALVRDSLDRMLKEQNAVSSPAAS